jgi:hypothetical protein
MDEGKKRKFGNNCEHENMVAAAPASTRRTPTI